MSTNRSAGTAQTGAQATARVDTTVSGNAVTHTSLNISDLDRALLELLCTDVHANVACIPQSAMVEALSTYQGRVRKGLDALIARGLIAPAGVWRNGKRGRPTLMFEITQAGWEELNRG